MAKPATAMDHSPKVVELPAAKSKSGAWSGDDIAPTAFKAAAGFGLLGALSGLATMSANREKVDTDEERARPRSSVGRPAKKKR